MSRRDLRGTVGVVIDHAAPSRLQTDELRRLVPAFAVVIAVVAAFADPSSAANTAVAVIPVAALTTWSLLRRVPLAAVSVAVVVPVVFAQRSGALEPLMFEASLLAFVVGRWSASTVNAVLLGAVAVACPVAVSVVQDPSQVAVGIWLLGIAFPWAIGRAAARQAQLAAALEESRRELAERAMLEERRRIARDVHDFVGHGLAAVMLQVTSARHVLRRDPDAAEEALQSAEEVGRRSMAELRRTVALLRSDDDGAIGAPVPTAVQLPALIDDSRAGGLAVELQVRGDLAAVAPGVGLALYRIAEEALANAARHAPHAPTRVRVELTTGCVKLVADTIGPDVPTTPGGQRRAGYGLVGMRERAAAVGGEFAAGPTEEGWRVSCELPLGGEVE
jgi:signal transduction histidine kinase